MFGFPSPALSGSLEVVACVPTPSPLPFFICHSLPALSPGVPMSIPPPPTTQHEFSIQVGGSSLLLTLKFPRSDCTSSPLAAADFLVISYKNLVLD